LAETYHTLRYRLYHTIEFRKLEPQSLYIFKIKKALLRGLFSEGLMGALYYDGIYFSQGCDLKEGSFFRISW